MNLVLMTTDALAETAHVQPLGDVTEEEAQEIVRRVTKGLKAFLVADLPWDEELFSVRAVNTLRRAKIKTLRELSTYEKLIDGAGAHTINEYRKVLTEAGLPTPEWMVTFLNHWKPGQQTSPKSYMKMLGME